MKNLIKYVLQKILGLQTYLYFFSLFMIKKLPRDRKEGAFLHFLKIIQNPQHIIDIGANIGVMTYHFAKKFPDATIHSFEPVIINYNILQRITRKYQLSNVHLYKYALGNMNGEEQMILPKSKGVTFHGLSHIVKGAEVEKGTIYKIPLKKLDDIEGFSDHSVSAIKIDVENYEYEVLSGAEKIIVKNRPLIYCELWEGVNRKNCIELMRKLNYSIFIVRGNELKLFDGIAKNQNFFFIPTEKRIN